MHGVRSPMEWTDHPTRRRRWSILVTRGISSILEMTRRLLMKIVKNLTLAVVLATMGASLAAGVYHPIHAFTVVGCDHVQHHDRRERDQPAQSHRDTE